MEEPFKGWSRPVFSRSSCGKDCWTSWLVMFQVLSSSFGKRPLRTVAGASDCVVQPLANPDRCNLLLLRRRTGLRDTRPTRTRKRLRETQESLYPRWCFRSSRPALRKTNPRTPFASAQTFALCRFRCCCISTKAKAPKQGRCGSLARSSSLAPACLSDLSAFCSQFSFDWMLIDEKLMNN